MIQIIPSLLVQTKEEWLRHYRGLNNSVEQIQIDIADGLFVPNTTWADPDVIAKELKIPCELHLMAADPLAEAKKWTSVKQVKRVLVHVESITSLSGPPASALSAGDWRAGVLTLAQSQGWQLGLALNPATPISALDPYLNDIQEVMFMGVTPGRQGAPFHPEVLQKIKEFKAKNTGHLVAIDGAVNEDTLPDLIAAGADIVCPGSAIFGNQKTPKENVERMRKLIADLTKQKLETRN